MRKAIDVKMKETRREIIKKVHAQKVLGERLMDEIGVYEPNDEAIIEKYSDMIRKEKAEYAE